MGVFLFVLIDKINPTYFRVIHIESLKYVQKHNMQCKEVLSIKDREMVSGKFSNILLIS